jgi:hypothetical protein
MSLLNLIAVVLFIAMVDREITRDRNNRPK